MPLTLGPVAANRPPILALPVPPVIRHGDELSCGAGLLVHSVDYVGYRPAGLGSTVGGAVDGRRRVGAGVRSFSALRQADINAGLILRIPDSVRQASIGRPGLSERRI